MYLFTCPVAESIAKRVLCLPLYYDILEEQQQQVINIIVQDLKLIA